MATNLDLTGLGRLIGRVKAIGDHDWTPTVAGMAQDLLAHHEARIDAGLDVDERPMPPTKRERSPALSRRLGGGPPLAPKPQSRTKTRARSGGFRTAESVYEARLWWENFTAANGRNVLEMHRKGEGRLPRRDVTGHPSPTDLRTARERVRRDAKAALKTK